MLAQTRITVKDSLGTERQAPLLYVSPNQANYLIPSGTPPGPVTITVTSGDGRVSQESLNVSTVAPALFAANSNGSGVAAGQVIVALGGGGQQTAEIVTFDQAAMRYVPLPVDLGGEGDVAFLILYGSGFRNVSGLSSVIATIGGVAGSSCLCRTAFRICRPRSDESYYLAHSRGSGFGRYRRDRRRQDREHCPGLRKVKSSRERQAPAWRVSDLQSPDRMTRQAGAPDAAAATRQRQAEA